ncbi:hypothetical protein PIB30_024899 [Stylosanthes scabra]|uniref:Uncharacterized protein n=1 Tax=Stylosanthes scabra TaxID=79078 RepID=A0ABU6S9Z6_9FABA|nr:hypothetical protein [Stylosanthes scabra]
MESQGHMLQQQIDEVKTLRDTLAQIAQRDERTEEHLRRMEEMQRQVAAFYNPCALGPALLQVVPVPQLHHLCHLVHHHHHSSRIMTTMVMTTTTRTRQRARASERYSRGARRRPLKTKSSLDFQRTHRRFAASSRETSDARR